MSPAEELRAAATLLRETASKATPGPWTTREVPDEPYAEVMAGTEVAVAHAVSEHLAGPGAAAEAEWIALMSPAVAEPLAASLEEAAQAAEFLSELADKSLINLTNALAVARALNPKENPS
ncbi:hypothetical protein [Actinomadura sp. GTD37]|uniref:hypothetical protein n=1 Tax=Actinomadura sp. GTD37 TaxID=1778030 RepID=UPI0035BEC1E6